MYDTDGWWYYDLEWERWSRRSETHPTNPFPLPTYDSHAEVHVGDEIEVPDGYVKVVRRQHDTQERRVSFDGGRKVYTASVTLFVEPVH